MCPHTGDRSAAAFLDKKAVKLYNYPELRYAKRMIKMKKIKSFSALAVIFLLAFCMAGCGFSGGRGLLGIKTDELIKILEAETDEQILYFYCYDFDGDGKKEAFAVTGTPEEGQDGWYLEGRLWFVSKNARVIEDGLYGYSNGLLKDKKYAFVSLEQSAHGSGSVSCVYGVKGGSPVEMNVSGRYGDFTSPEQYVYSGCVDDFSKGYHDYIYTDFIFDENIFAFREKK